MTEIIEQAFQGVIFNISYFKEIEEKLLTYQLKHPSECIPIVPFFSNSNKKKLDDFYVSDITPAKSYDEYMFSLVNYGFPFIVQDSINKHPEWSRLVIRYE